MSGHSKWSTIKRQKGTADVKRGATFTKLSNAITLAVKQGGGIGDPNQNFKLRLAVDAAKTSNMPKETIERAIARANGKDASSFEEMIYEGFAPGGVAVIVEAATDNTNRTSSEIKNIFNKAGANFGQPGSVSYLFQTVGEVIVKKNGRTFDEIFGIGVDSGAEDVEDLGEEVALYVSAGDLNSFKERLTSEGFDITSADFVRKPTTKLALPEEQTKKVLNFLETVEALDDVQKVYSNVSY